MKKFLPILFFITGSAQSQSYFSKELKEKVITMRRFLDQQHLQPVNWNDSTSAILFNLWIEELDDFKLYFTQKDIQDLNQYKTKLDGEVHGHSWDFFDASIKIYRSRLIQTDSIAKKICSIPFEFTKPETIQWPFADFVANEAMLFQRWQQYYKLRMLSKFESMDTAAAYLNQPPPGFVSDEKKIRALILKRHNATMYSELQPQPEFEKRMAERYLNTICQVYDPHTSYFTLGKKEEFNTALSGFEFSTGLNLNQNDNGEWEVVNLIPGGPAWNSGAFHKGDIVISIKPALGAEQVLEEMNEEQVYELLQGTNSESVLIRFRTKNGNTRTLSLQKEKVENEAGTVKSYVLGESEKVGYIRLPDFYTQSDAEEENLNGCANDVAKEIMKLKKDSISGLILDLRSNGGGSIQEALQLAGIFLDQGTLVTVRTREGVQFLKDPNRGTIYDGPLLVMINGQSASASELVSSVLQDYNRALIAGGTSFGKGTAQGIAPLDTTGRLSEATAPDFVKVTSGRFYRVNGSSVQWKGVIPDIPLPDPFVWKKMKESGEPTALLPDETKKAVYKALPALPVDRLLALSEKRRNSDSRFGSLTASVNYLKEIESGIKVPLQWAPYRLAMQKQDRFYAAWDPEVYSNLIPVRQNSFDQKREALRQSASNLRFMKELGSDLNLAECYQIVCDWSKGL